jgi:hypothetical protein
MQNTSIRGDRPDIASALIVNRVNRGHYSLHLQNIEKGSNFYTLEMKNISIRCDRPDIGSALIVNRDHYSHHRQNIEKGSNF